MNEEFKIKMLLLIEDSDADIIVTKRKIYKSILNVDNLLIAKNLTEAKNILQEKSNQVDVVLLDLNLPETEGVTSLLKIREIYDGVIVVVTSIDDELLGIESIKKGADDYLVKSDMTEQALARAVLYSRQRKKLKDNIQKASDSLNQLPH